MRSPSRTQWTSHETSSQPFTLFSFNFLTCGFVLVGFKIIITIIIIIITNLPKVIWGEGRIAALRHKYAVKTPLVTMARPKFAPKSTPSSGPIPKSHYLPHPWTRPTYDAKRHPDLISRFFHNALDRPTHRPTDRPRESLITIIGRCATRATRPKTDEKELKNRILQQKSGKVSESANAVRIYTYDTFKTRLSSCGSSWLLPPGLYTVSQKSSRL